MAKKRETDKNKSKNAIKYQNAHKVVITPLKLKNEIFRNALFKFHGIRDLRVVLQRIPIESLAPVPKKKMLLCAPKIESVRMHVPWLPKKLGSKPLAAVNINNLPQSKPTTAKRDRNQSFYNERPGNDDGCGAINGHHGTLRKS